MLYTHTHTHIDLLLHCEKFTKAYYLGSITNSNCPAKEGDIVKTWMAHIQVQLLGNHITFKSELCYQ